MRAERVRVRGYVYDGDRAGVPDALLEFWHADDFVRAGTDAAGAYTIDAACPESRHLSIAVFARGLLNHLFTRMYFPDEAGGASDPILLRVPAARRATLLARRESDAEYRFDIVLQGDGETVFFDFK